MLDASGSWRENGAHRGSMTVLNFYHIGRVVPPGAVYIGRGRGGSWGNQFTIGVDGTREEVVAKHEAWVRSQPELMERIRKELRGKDLVCFCAPHACHGDTYDAIANEELDPMTGILSNPDRLSGLEPGTILREHDTDSRIMVIWGGHAVCELRKDERGFVYADAESILTFEAKPVENPKPVSERTRHGGTPQQNIDIVAKLPLGAIFEETDDLGRHHRFIKTFHGCVNDNGTYEVHEYNGYTEGTSLTVLSVSRPSGERLH